MMFKVLVLQKMYGLSDAGIEYHVTGRLSFMRFLGLALSDKVVDEKTVWLFRDTLGQAGVIDELFNQLTDKLRSAGLILNQGKIVDAQIVQAPIQRNNRDENRQIKEGCEARRLERAQKPPKRHRCPMDKEKRTQLFRL